MDLDEKYRGDLVVTAGRWVNGFKILVTFSNGDERLVDFERFIQSHAKHECVSSYVSISGFKRFKVEDGNIVWGKDWDMIFPVMDLYRNSIS